MQWNKYAVALMAILAVCAGMVLLNPTAVKASGPGVGYFTNTPLITQDGYITGRLNNTYFDQNGVLVGSYTNGQLLNLYKLPVATFAADDNLNALPGNVFTQTAEAGALNLKGVGDPNAPPPGAPGAVAPAQAGARSPKK